MYVIENGPTDAPVILLVHGFASSSRAFDRLVAALPDRRVVRVDLLGHGRTGGAAGDAVTQAAAVAGVLADLDLHDVTAVGHSFGADVVLALGADPRVARVVVLAQGPDYAGTRIPRARLLTPALTRRLHRVLQPLAGALAPRLSRWPVIAGGLTDARAVDPAMVGIVLTGRRATLAGRPLDVQAAALDVPVTVVLGGRDRLYGTCAADRYRAAGARVEIIPGSGHAMPQQHPDAVAVLLRDLTR